jgi:hypothetical protein
MRKSGPTNRRHAGEGPRAADEARPIGPIARSVSTNVGYMSDPSGFVARHVIPCAIPLIHIAER